MSKLNYYVLAIFFAAISLSVSAQTVKGKVSEKKTGESLVDAVMVLKNDHKTYYVSVKLDGSFTFKNIEAGEYTLTARITGYASQTISNVVAKKGTITEKSFQLEEAATDLNDVTVKSSHNKETIDYARNLERVSDVSSNILSAKAIELSPDVTVANSLQRMSGVSMQSSKSGEGRFAIIRGMDARYNTTLVNGIEIPSPSNTARYVPMNIFPADILQRLEVIKTLTPNMEANAIGGVMNLVMKDAPNKQEFKIFAAGGTNTIFGNGNDFVGFYKSDINTKSPQDYNPGKPVTMANFPTSNLTLYTKSQPIDLQSGLTYGNRYFHKKLGFVLSLSYQDLFRYTKQNLFASGVDPQAIVNANGIKGDTLNNYPSITDIYYNRVYTEQKRFALNNKIDYVINSKNKISLYNLYVSMDEYQTRLQSDTTLPSALTYTTRTNWISQSIYNSTLHGEHQLAPRVSLNWSAAYSLAKQNQPDYAYFSYTNSYGASLQNSQYYAHDSGTAGSMTRSWEHNSDQDIAGYINLIVKRTIAKREVEFSAGGMYRHKTRDNYYWEYNFSPPSKTVYQYADNFSINPAVPYTVSATKDSGSNGGDARNYSVTEDVSAGYGMAKFMATKKLQVIGGLRMETTDQTYNTDLSVLDNGKTGHIYYYDLLPSLHLKYDLKYGQDIRASYFRSLIRPSFNEIIPFTVPAGQNEAYASQGNPYLKHTTADNYDLRYSYFPKHSSDELLVGAFLKEIYNPVEVSFQTQQVTLPNGTISHLSSLILTPVNLGTVTNEGLEFLGVKYFGYFGISANYTYTHSATTQVKNYYYYPINGRNNVFINQTRPLQGQAENIGNVSLLYKNKKIGLDMQLAYVYTGERIQTVSNYYNLDVWQAPFGQFDFSFTERVTKKFEVYGKVINLTNEKTNYYIKTPLYNYNGFSNNIPLQDNPSKHILVEKDEFQTSIFLGLRFKL